MQRCCYHTRSKLGWRRKVIELSFMRHTKLRIIESNIIFSLGCGIGYGYLHRIPHNLVRERIANAEAGNEKPKKTFSSALGINSESGAGLPPPPVSVGQSVPSPGVQQPPSAPLPSNVETSAASLFTPPVSAAATPSMDSNGHPEPESQQPASPSLPVSGSQPQGSASPVSMAPSQTITTPLNIPGMPPITVSAPLIMPPPMQQGPPMTATSIPSSMIGTSAAPPTMVWGMPPQQQRSPSPSTIGGGFQTPPPLTANYHPRPVALFNPVANSTPNSNAPENFVKMYDPNNPTGQPAVSQS